MLMEDHVIFNRKRRREGKGGREIMYKHINHTANKNMLFVPQHKTNKTSKFDPVIARIRGMCVLSETKSESVI